MVLLGKGSILQVAIVGLAFALFLTACSSGDKEVTSTSAQQPQAGATAAPTSAPPSVEPQVSRVILAITPWRQEGNIRRVLGQISGIQFDPMDGHLLIVNKDDGTLEPGLATEWNVEPDGKSIRFKLRKGILFQKGWGEFTATDVRFVWEDYNTEDALGGHAQLLRNKVKDVEVVNDYEVVFHMDPPDADLVSAMSQSQVSVGIQSRAHFEAVGDPTTLDDEPIVSTGPYQFVGRTLGQFLRFERVPYDHWLVRPDFPEFEFQFMAEPSTRLAALLAGEVHMTNMPEDLFPSATNAGMEVVRAPASAFRIWGLIRCCFKNPETGAWPFKPSPLDDVRVRKALSKAVNRDELNQAFFAGKGAINHLPHYSASREGWNPAWKTRFAEEYGYDPAAARDLLAEAGFGPGNPLETNIHLSKIATVPSAEDVQEAMAGYFRDVGVNVNLVTLDSAISRAKLRNFEFFNDIMMGASSGGQFITVRVYSTNSAGPGRQSNVSTPEMDTLFTEIQGILDPVKREQMWTTLGDTIYDMHAGIPLLSLPVEAIINPEIIAEYDWPGSLSGTWSHAYNIRAAG